MATTKKKRMRAGVPGRTAKRSPTAAQIRAYREALKRAIEAACVARGQVEFTTGYRCGRAKDDDEDRRLFDRSLLEYARCADRDDKVLRAIQDFARIVRASR